MPRRPDAPAVVAIFGPTGIGKTSIAIALADSLRSRGEDPVAVSVDSMQVYREIPIITGAPTARQRAALEHRLTGSVSVADRYDVATHAAAAHREIDQLRSERRRPIVVGGTGLYLRAALTELDLLPPPDQATRERLLAEFEQEGREGLHARLTELDPEVAVTIKPGDARRTLRALEALEAGESARGREANRLWTAETRVPTWLFALTMNRDELYGRIDARVDEMVALGARSEVIGARSLAGQTARQALGFAELIDGDVARLKTNTRRYAKRQLTWLRKLAGASVIDVTGRSAADVAAEIAASVADRPTN
ncbi:MAG: tRNA (adenosine(37)-N6)-dimethylallyltransferase MiaA [Solirubrobacterales bacterium]